MNPQSPRNPSSQTGAKSAPYLRSASSQGPEKGLAQQSPLEYVVTINDAGDGEWAVGLGACLKEPMLFLEALFWPCGIAGRVVTAMGRPPAFAWTFIAAALLGDVIFTAITLYDAYSSDKPPSVYYNISLYYFAAKPTSSIWSVIGHLCGVLFVRGVWRLRTRMQEFYGIKRSCGFDLYATLLCTCCSLAQMAKHVEIRTREQQAAQGGRIDTLPAFAHE